MESCTKFTPKIGVLCTLEISVKVCYNVYSGKGVFISRIPKNTKGVDSMPLRWKTDVLKQLKEKGYNTNRIRKDHIMGESMLQKLRSGSMVSWSTFETICKLLDCQPGDLIEFHSEDD